MEQFSKSHMTYYDRDAKSGLEVTQGL